MVKDLVLSLLWRVSLIWREFYPWPRNVCMLQVQPKPNQNKTNDLMAMIFFIMERMLRKSQDSLVLILTYTMYVTLNKSTFRIVADI